MSMKRAPGKVLSLIVFYFRKITKIALHHPKLVVTQSNLLNPHLNLLLPSPSHEKLVEATFLLKAVGTSIDSYALPDIPKIKYFFMNLINRHIVESKNCKSQK